MTFVVVLVVVVALAGVAVVVATSRGADAAPGGSVDDELAYLRDLGLAGRRMTVHAAEPGEVPDEVTTIERLLAGLGFERIVATRSELPGRPAEVTAHLGDAGRHTVIRVGRIPELISPPSVSATSWFPGGRVVTSRLVAVSALPDEIVQCVPDATPTDVVDHHRAALAALAARGAEPVAAPDDLAAALQDEWRTESAVMVDGDRDVRLALATQLRSGPKRSRLVDAPDLDAIAARLAGTGPGPGPGTPHAP